MPADVPDFDAVGRLLADSPLAPSAAEAHGIYCGLVAAAADEPERRWLAELLPTASNAEPQAADSRAALSELAEHTRARIADAGIGFDLLLPPEERPLRERAGAVHDWARGFLFGLGLAGVDAARLSPQSREVFDDLVELMRMDLDELEEDQANEQALTEVAEFIRVAALMVYEDDVPRDTSS